MRRKTQAAERTFEEERAKLAALIEQEHEARTAELKRSLAILRSELGGILAEDARRLIEERRQGFEENERRAAERRRNASSASDSPAPRIARSVPRLLTRICPRISTKNE